MRWRRGGADSEARDATLHLVTKTLGLERLSDVAQMLRAVGESVGAVGCVLWQMHPAATEDVHLEDRCLFVLAQWFADGHVHPLYNLPVRGSAAGRAATSGHPVYVPDVQQPGAVHPDDLAHLTTHGLRSIYVTPVAFAADSLGVLSVYAGTTGNLAKEEQRLIIDQGARFVPRLYQALSDRVHVDLVNAIAVPLDASDLTPPTAIRGQEEILAAIHRICRLVRRSFEAIEVSAILKDEQQKFQMVTASADDAWHGGQAANPTDGLTSWVLANDRSVRLFDVTKLEHERLVIEREYVGLDLTDISAMVQAHPSGIGEPGSAPVSCAAVPIKAAGHVIGVLRCISALSGPCYFSERDLGLLQTIAVQVAQHWETWLERQESGAEHRAWSTLTEGLQCINREVAAMLVSGDLDEGPVFDAVLALAQAAVPEADAVDVRLVDRAKNELYFAYPKGTAWDEGSVSLQEWRRRRRFTLDQASHESIGQVVFLTGETYEHPPVRALSEAIAAGEAAQQTRPGIAVARRAPPFNPTFPETKQIIVVAIGEDGDRIGVLDLRRMGPRPFSRDARVIAEILAQQLSLYCSLLRSHAMVRAAQADALARLRVQNEFFTDLDHQIRSPVTSGYLRMRRVVPIFTGDSILARQLTVVRGLLARAYRVSMNTRVFSQVEQHGQLELRRERLTDIDLRRLVLELFHDNEILLAPRRKIGHAIGVEARTNVVASEDDVAAVQAPRSFHELLSCRVMVDAALLEQALGNVLDNAYKYSFRNTSVQVTAQVAAQANAQWFTISVLSQGIRVGLDDALHCHERGYRGQAAITMTGEGQGLGLFIVDRIMRAHGGSVRILPTRPDQVTEVQLAFPVARGA